MYIYINIYIYLYTYIYIYIYIYAVRRRFICPREFVCGMHKPPIRPVVSIASITICYRLTGCTEVLAALEKLVPVPGCALGHYDKAKVSSFYRAVTLHHRIPNTTRIIRICHYRIAERHWSTELRQSRPTTRLPIVGRTAVAPFTSTSA